MPLQFLWYELIETMAHMTSKSGKFVEIQVVPVAADCVVAL